MEYADSQDSTCSSLNNSSPSASASPSAAAPRGMPSLLPLQLQAAMPVSVAQQQLGLLSQQQQQPLAAAASLLLGSPGSPDRNLCSSTTQVTAEGVVTRPVRTDCHIISQFLYGFFAYQSFFCP